MWALGPIAFATPWVLGALAFLPVLWWLLRISPPAPFRVLFPPIRILMELRQVEETPARTPIWLLILRLLLATLIILALARPLLHPDVKLIGTGEVVIVVDDGWPAARDWQRRVKAMTRLVDAAERNARPVLVLTTAPAPTASENPAELIDAKSARRLIRAMEPKAWLPDRQAVLARLAERELNIGSDIVWISDGLDYGNAPDFAAALERFGQLRVVLPGADHGAVALLPPEPEGTALRIGAIRGDTASAAKVWIRAMAEQGRILARQPLSFEAGSAKASGTLRLPAEFRNKIQRLDIEGVTSAGAVVLMDEKWRRRPVGLVAEAAGEGNQPLLSEIFYLERAMKPFAEIRKGPTATLLARQLAVIVLADVGRIVGSEHAALKNWVEGGGVLVRFAGPHLAESVDELIPVRLRRGGRELGGALSWSKPARLAAFPDTGPFAGLTPPTDVTVHRQVLAEPTLDLGGKTWARLADGTPLVTAEKRGKGHVVLFHTTANTHWSNLAISGLFVDMLHRLVDLSHGVAGMRPDAMLAPLAELDGFGRLRDPSTTVLPIQADQLIASGANADHPPGYYGDGGSRHAFNATSDLESLTAMQPPADAQMLQDLLAAGERDLMPWLLAVSLVLMLVDFMIIRLMQGRYHRAAITAMLAICALATLPTDQVLAQATGPDARVLTATTDTRLAYVRTGDRDIDDMSDAGLWGLTEMLRRRTSVEGEKPIGVNVERDEILFFPLLYWPITPSQPALSNAALAKVDAFMKTGGSIFFDTQDQDGPAALGGGATGGAKVRLRQLLRRLDIPPLVPVPENHVLTKAFYLMQDFPGRWNGGRLWVEQGGDKSNDGVSSIIIGSNSWAAAWAVDDAGRPLAAVVPGGERQREMAFRFGVNLVMYVLTGNYKADQVHVPAILERLGQ
jgi:hypothetical protein